MMEKQMTNTEQSRNVNALRNQFPLVIYDSYEMVYQDNTLFITFHYETCGLDTFVSKWEIPVVSCGSELNKQWNPCENIVVRKLVFSLGMVELMSYWKITCSPKIQIKAGSLHDEQIDWWKKLLRKGMGEYFYRNEISFTDEELVTFECMNNSDISKVDCSDAIKQPTSNILIPVGGGKDSVVTLDILRRYFPSAKTYMINPKGANLDTATVTNQSQAGQVCVKRSFDSKMIAYNNQGFLNGHTPFSAIVAFSGVLSAYLNGCDTVVLSNESSANEASVAGTDVNHQYSKSYEFEKDFSMYLNTYIAEELTYFSFLRPLSEYQIGKYFASLPAYHSVFRSCNLGSKHNVWCNNCAKCLYVYVLLSAFLKPTQMIEIFHENLLERTDMKEMFDDLIGLTEEKPFECVGSIDEINMAIIDAIAMHTVHDWDLPYLLAYYTSTTQYEANRHRHNSYLCYYDREHALPVAYQAILEKEFHLPCIQ